MTSIIKKTKMTVLISVALEHWIVSGGVVIVLLLSLTQVEYLIDIAIETGKYHKYEVCVISLVATGYIWIIISAIAVLDTIWLIF